MIVVNWALNNVQKKNDQKKMIEKINHQKKLNKNEGIAKSHKTTLSDQIVLMLNKKNFKYWVSDDFKKIIVGFNFEKGGVIDIHINIFDRYLEFTSLILSEIQDDSVSAAIEITSRLNQHLNFGHLNFYFEDRGIAYHYSCLFVKNEINESIFYSCIDYALLSVSHCRPIIYKAVVEKEEPFLAMMNFETNS